MFKGQNDNSSMSPRGEGGTQPQIPDDSVKFLPQTFPRGDSQDSLLVFLKENVPTKSS